MEQSMNIERTMKHSFDLPTNSEARVLSHVLRNADCTQLDIVKATGMSQQSVSRLVNDLLARGALMLGDRRVNGRRGQPRIEIRIAPDYAYSLGVALMTDAMSVLLMDFSGQVVGYEYVEMPSMTRRAVFDRLQKITDSLIAQLHEPNVRIFGVGIGISGYNLDGKSRYNPPHALDDWAMVDVDALFSEALGLPAWVENDGNAAAIGESLLGVGREYANFVYVFVAAGIGGGVISDHRLLRGVHGNGGEIGLILPRGAYQLPTLETLLQSVRKHGVNLDGIAEMLANFDPDWPGVDEWIDRCRDPLSLIASSIAALLDPEAIVLGGRLPPVLARKIIPSIELFDDARRQEARPLPRILLSQTQYDACAIGAAMLPLERAFFST
jgi:predicted NBD/HSP70 family sugar kinase